MTVFDLLAVLFSYDDLSKEYLSMFNDYAGWAALLLFLGGLIFWLILLFLALVGIARGVSRAYGAVVDAVEARRNPAPIPHIES